MIYTLGVRARGEHGSLTGRKSHARHPRRPRQLALPLTTPESILATVPMPQESEPAAPAAPTLPDAGATDTETLALADQLTAHGLGKGAAKLYAQANPEECRRQLAYLPYITGFKSSKGAYLRKAIEDGYGPPKGYGEAQAAVVAHAKAENRIAVAKARQYHEDAHRSAYNAYLEETLTQMENTATESYNAFLEWERKDRLLWARGPLAGKEYAQQRLATFDQPEERLGRFRRYLAEREKEKQRVPGVPSFWEWDKAHNHEPFQA